MTQPSELEQIAAYLAGRRGPAADAVRSAMVDPESAPSLLLESLRRRTREAPGLALAASAREPWGERPAPTLPAPAPAVEAPRRAGPGPRPWPWQGRRWGAVAAAAALVLVVGVGWGLVAELGRLGSALDRREEGWRRRVARLEALLVRRDPKPVPPPPTAARPALPPRPPADPPLLLALNRVEAKLGALEARAAAGPSAGPAPAPAPPVATASFPADDRAIARLRRDLDALRESLEQSDRANRLEAQEVRGALQDALMMLRQVLTLQNQSQQRIPVPVPFPFPVHPNGQPAQVVPGR